MRYPVRSLLALTLAACDNATPVDVSMDGGDDGPATHRCAVAAPRIGGTTETDALADAPAQCGQRAHRWQRSPRLGEPGELRAPQEVDAATSRVLLTVGKVPVPATVHNVKVEQLSYTTQDRGALLSATGLLAYPTDMKETEAADVLLVLHGTSGFTDQCAPSSEKDARTLIAALASLGYVVVAPDYIGLRAFGGPTGFIHPYLVGQATAIASLDAVRAAAQRLAKPDGALCTTTRFATVGGSQGGHAALWVDRLAPYYAPELTHVGAVATVPPADLVGEGLRALASAVPASANLAAFYAASSGWYDAQDRLGEVFVAPLHKELPEALATSCNPDDKIKGKTLPDLFTPQLLAAAKDPAAFQAFQPWGCMAVQNGLTTTAVKRIAPPSPGYGILFLLGEADALVNPEVERKSFDTLCQQGLPLTYLECAKATHTKATTWALPEIVEFVQARFAGRPLQDRCQRGPAVTCRGTTS